MGRVEERQLVGPVAEHRHAERLEQLCRRRNVEQRLDAGRDDERLRRRERLQVGRDVGRRRPAAMNAAEPARGHHLDADRAAHGERAADGGRADRALCDRGGEVAWADLPRVRAEPLQLLGRQPDHDFAVEHADRCRHRAARRAPLPPTRARPRRLRPAESRARRASSRARRRADARAAPRPRCESRHRTHLRAAARCRVELPSSARRRGSLRRVRRLRPWCRRARRRRPRGRRRRRSGRARLASAPTASRAPRPRRCSRSVAKTRSGASAATCARNASSTSVHVEMSSETVAPCSRACARLPRRPRTRSARGAARSRRGGARRNRTTPGRGRAERARARCRGRTPSSGRRPRRSRRRRRFVRPRGRDARRLAVRARAATSSPAASSPTRPTKRAYAPSDAAHAATFAAWPPAPVLVRRRLVVARHERLRRGARRRRAGDRRG